MSHLPRFLGALLVLVIGWILAEILKVVITKLLRKAELDERLTHGEGGEYVGRVSPQASPAALVGTRPARSPRPPARRWSWRSRQATPPQATPVATSTGNGNGSLN